MNIHTTKGGETLSGLARSLYKLEKPRGPEPELKAIDALRKANPQLAEAKVIPAGTMIMIPTLDGYHRLPVADPTQKMATTAARQLREVLGRVGTVLDTAVAEEAKADRDTSRKLEKMAKEKALLVPGKKIAERLDSINDATKERAKLFAAQRIVQEKGIAQVTKDLEAFLRIHDSAGLES